MEIGIIGLGGMGKLYARTFAQKGYVVHGCDLPEKRNDLEQELRGTGINLLSDGVAVSRRSDLIIYSVEAENIEEAVAACGPATKLGAIVGGQTSVKTPEIAAFEKYLPNDAHIVTCHSLHGPSVPPAGHGLVVVRHRSSDQAYAQALKTFGALGSTIIELTDFQEHDRITADTQAATHVGFESMGTAWKNAGFYPWENASYAGGIDTIKILMMLRMYGGKAHVYSGVAIMNPYAQRQVRQYAKSASDLFSLMIREEEQKFKEKLYHAGQFVFDHEESPILLDEHIMEPFCLGEQKESKPNSHLSLLAMVDAWHQLEVNPYINLICSTPLFRLRLGIAEYLFRNKGLLEESLNTALFDKKIRAHDLEFLAAVREWANIIEHGDIHGYEKQFMATREFFADRISEGMKKSDELIQRLANVSLGSR